MWFTICLSLNHRLPAKIIWHRIRVVTKWKRFAQMGWGCRWTVLINHAAWTVISQNCFRMLSASPSCRSFLLICLGFWVFLWIWSIHSFIAKATFQLGCLVFTSRLSVPVWSVKTSCWASVFSLAYIAFAELFQSYSYMHRDRTALNLARFWLCPWISGALYFPANEGKWWLANMSR